MIYLKIFMNLTIEQIGMIGTLILSIIAIVISALAFFRGRNIDLQNQLYLKKLDAYEAIIGEFQKVINLLLKASEKMGSLEFSNSFIKKIEDLNELEEELYLKIDNSRNEIAKKSGCFSKNFVEDLLTKVDTLYGEMNVNSLENKRKIEGELELHFKLQINNFELLIHQMRDELGLDNLNQKLFKRIKKGNFRIGI